MVQALLSANAAAEGVAGGGEQALREALTLQPAVPLEGVASRDQQESLAVRTEHSGPSSVGSNDGGVVPGNQPMVDNYLRIDSVGRVLLDRSVELRSEDFPQSRDDDAHKQRNLLLAYAACGYKCPVQGCNNTEAPRGGMQSSQLVRDEDHHLLSLCVEPQIREKQVFTH